MHLFLLVVSWQRKCCQQFSTVRVRSSGRDLGASHGHDFEGAYGWDMIAFSFDFGRSRGKHIFPYQGMKNLYDKKRMQSDELSSPCNFSIYGCHAVQVNRRFQATSTNVFHKAQRRFLSQQLENAML